MKKKLLSILLATLMVATLLPVAAYAGEVKSLIVDYDTEKADMINDDITSEDFVKDNNEIAFGCPTKNGEEWTVAVTLNDNGHTDAVLEATAKAKDGYVFGYAEYRVGGTGDYIKITEDVVLTDVDDDLYFRFVFNMKPTVTDSDGEPVDPGSDTYDYEVDGIHVYGKNIVFSGYTEERFFIADTANELIFKDMIAENDIIADGLADSVIVYMDNSEIRGDVIATDNGEDDLYLIINIEGTNIIKGDVTSDGSVTVYGDPDAVLKVKSITANTLLYLQGLRLENMKEEYDIESTLTATADDTAEPIVLTVKKQALFQKEGDYVVNGGKTIKCGDTYEVGAPVVYDKNRTAFDPQPELDVVYYEKTSDEEYDWVIKALEEKPDKAGDYYAVFFMPESDPNYTGSEMYEFTIEHDLKKISGKSATKTAAGYKACYYCEECEEYFEDSKGKTLIEDLEEWRAKGGRGYISKETGNKSSSNKKNVIEDDDDIAVINIAKNKTEDNPDTGASVGASIGTKVAMSVAVLCACAFVLAKKKDD